MKNSRDLRFELGILLTALRHQNGLSVRELAAKSKLNAHTIGIMETGTVVNWIHYFKLLRYYDYDIKIELVKAEAKDETL